MGLNILYIEGQTPIDENNSRSQYLASVKAADNGDLAPLIAFARS